MKIYVCLRILVSFLLIDRSINQLFQDNSAQIPHPETEEIGSDFDFSIAQYHLEDEINKTPFRQAHANLLYLLSVACSWCHGCQEYMNSTQSMAAIVHWSVSNYFSDYYVNKTDCQLLKQFSSFLLQGNWSTILQVLINNWKNDDVKVNISLQEKIKYKPVIERIIEQEKTRNALRPKRTPADEALDSLLLFSKNMSYINGFLEDSFLENHCLQNRSAKDLFDKQCKISLRALVKEKLANLTHVVATVLREQEYTKNLLEKVIRQMNLLEDMKQKAIKQQILYTALQRKLTAIVKIKKFIKKNPEIIDDLFYDSTFMELKKMEAMNTSSKISSILSFVQKPQVTLIDKERNITFSTIPSDGFRQKGDMHQYDLITEKEMQLSDQERAKIFYKNLLILGKINEENKEAHLPEAVLDKLNRLFSIFRKYSNKRINQDTTTDRKPVIEEPISPDIWRVSSEYVGQDLDEDSDIKWNRPWSKFK